LRKGYKVNDCIDDEAGKPVVDVQGIGISSASKYKKEAADFIMFMHTPERLNALYATANVFPANLDWNGSAIVKTPNEKEQWKWFTGDKTAYICNMIAWTFDSEVMYTAPQLLMNREKTAKEIAQNAEEVMKRWREENPDMVESHKKWAE